MTRMPRIANNSYSQFAAFAFIRKFASRMYFMHDKDLFKHLNNLKTIKPDRAWKERNRELLFKQISGDSINENRMDETKLNFLQILESCIAKYAVNIFSQPAWIAAIIAFLMVAGGTASVFASHNAKPGDSLYIAKIISEKAQLALTFGDKEKAKLNIEFAGNRAKELFQVINESNDGSAKQEKIEKLSNDFKKEIAAVKTNFGKINSNNANENKNEIAGNKPQAVEPGKQNEDNQVFGANAGKSDKGMNVAEHTQNSGVVQVEEKKQETASSTESSRKIKGGVLGKTLDEAEKLFNSKDLSGTLNKLTEANGIIDSGEVKNNDKETATSSGEVLGAREEAGAASSAAKK